MSIVKKVIITFTVLVAVFIAWIVIGNWIYESKKSDSLKFLNYACYEQKNNPELNEEQRKYWDTACKVSAENYAKKYLSHL